MKKLASILLLSILTFNWVGYRLVTTYLQQQATAKLEAQLDENKYDETELFEIRVPIELPYQTNWQDFERFDGEVEVNGIHYKYVKRKVENGEMVLLCIPDKGRTNLRTARDDFFRLVNDLKHNGQGKTEKSSSPLAIKNPVTEYFADIAAWRMNPLLLQAQEFIMRQDTFSSSGYLNSPIQPPDFIS